MKTVVILSASRGVLIARVRRIGRVRDSGESQMPWRRSELRSRRGGAAETVTAYGVAEQAAGNEHALTTQAEATLARIVAPTGTAVGAGQVVAVLNPSANSQLDLGKAATDARSAQDALARAVRLRRDGLASDADVNSARATYQTAAQTLKAARESRCHACLESACRGNRPRADCEAGRSDRCRNDSRDHRHPRRSTGSSWDRSLDRAPGCAPASLSRSRASTRTASVATNVIGVDPQVDPTTHLASVYARLPAVRDSDQASPLRLRSLLSGAAAGVTIPYSALLDDGGRTYVFVVQNGVAKRRDVTPGNSGG